MKLPALVATPTALFAGSVGLSKRGKTHGSPSALTVATTAIFIRSGELEKSMSHSVLNARVTFWDQRPIVLLRESLFGLN